MVQVWQPSRPASLSLAGLTLWLNWLEPWLATDCAINPGSKPSGVVGAGTLHKIESFLHWYSDSSLYSLTKKGLEQRDQPTVSLLISSEPPPRVGWAVCLGINYFCGIMQWTSWKSHNAVTALYIKTRIHAIANVLIHQISYIPKLFQEVGTTETIWCCQSI